MIDTVLFDFDYTLADASEGIIQSVNYALTQMSYTECSDRQIRRTIGLPLSDTFSRLTGNKQRSQQERFKSHFIQKADQVMLLNSHLLPFVRETWFKLVKDGYRLGIVSSKFRYRIEDFCGRENLPVDCIIGTEDVASLKPHPEGLIKAVTMLETTIDQCIYVGDNVIDAQAAAAAGVQFVAVLSGVTEKPEFNDCTGIEIIDDLSSLLDTINHLK